MADKPDYLVEGEGFVDVTLSRPLTIDGAPVSVLRMREPTVDDQITAADAKGSEAAKEVAFFANLCEQAPADIRRLPVRDFVRLQSAFAGFID